MNIYTTSEARANLFQLVEKANLTHEPVCIKNKRGSAIILSMEDYESMQETLYLYSIPNLVKTVLESSKEPLEECTEWTDEI